MSSLVIAVGLCGAVLGTTPEIDYAESQHVDKWLRHPVYGDPSFDAFKRVSGNPIHRGQPPFEWPVNGFFFADPLGGKWYLYVGDYCFPWIASPMAAQLSRPTGKFCGRPLRSKTPMGRRGRSACWRNRIATSASIGFASPASLSKAAWHTSPRKPCWAPAKSRPTGKTAASRVSATAWA